MLHKIRFFDSRDTMYIRNYLGGEKWIPGIISEITGPVSYQVTLANGKILKRHFRFDNAQTTQATNQWTPDSYYQHSSSAQQSFPTSGSCEVI